MTKNDFLRKVANTASPNIRQDIVTTFADLDQHFGPDWWVELQELEITYAQLVQALLSSITSDDNKPIKQYLPQTPTVSQEPPQFKFTIPKSPDSTPEFRRINIGINGYPAIVLDKAQGDDYGKFLLAKRCTACGGAVVKDFDTIQPTVEGIQAAMREVSQRFFAQGHTDDPNGQHKNNTGG